jgi:hypothetical protein
MLRCNLRYYRQVPRNSEENHVKSCPGWPFFGSIFEPGLPEYEALVLTNLSPRTMTVTV